MTGSEHALVIIVAWQKERVQLESLLPNQMASHGFVRPVCRYTVNDRVVYVVESGVGMVKAAAATEFAIHQWKPAAILNFGCAGSHRRDLHPGDVVIGTSSFNQGRIRFEADGTMVPITTDSTVPGAEADQSTWWCDPTLVAIAEDAAGEIEFPAWPGSADGHTTRVATGAIASGDVWLQDTRMIEDVSARRGSMCEDMEAAAIGEIAGLYGTPFLSIKDISNNEFAKTTTFGDEGEGLVGEEVGRRSAMLLAEVIRRLPVQAG